MAFVDAIDSHYQLVKSRLAATTPNFPARGLLMAQDWPPKNVQNGFYLLTLKDSPIGRQGYSAAVPIKFHNVMWQWLIIGTDLKSGQRSNNRGDRFRTLWSMKGALVGALYPNFTEKKTWSLDANGNWVGVALDPQEFITWTPLEIHEDTKQDSGIVYANGMTRIANMTDLITG